MIFHSASYSYMNPNFTIENLEKTDVCSEYTSAICVLKNILTRGIAIPKSDFLEEKTGELKSTEENPIYLSSETLANWDKTIKGGTNYNPALIFYNKVLTDLFSDKSQIKNLILPEATFEYIDEKEEEYKKYSFDFYFPQVDLVIEIDGSQHEKETEKLNDNQKEKWAKAHGLNVVRIHADEINSEKKKEEIKKIIYKKNAEKNKILNEYGKDLLEIKEEYIEDLKSQYIIRLQLLILDLLHYGKISLNDKKWKFEIKSSDDLDLDLSHLLSLAIDDTFCWLKNILSAQGLNLKLPKYDINAKNSDIKIDISILSRRDDTTDKSFYVIRNDYKDYDYTNTKKNEYGFANYFELSIDKRIDYKNITEQSLSFLFKNIFGYQFRAGQYRIVRNILEGRDTIGILPTGSGKSVCYQLASVLEPCVCFAVCPIKSLMEDQNRNIKRFHFHNTQFINSDSENREELEENFKSKKYSMIWISPERFQSLTFRDALKEVYADKKGLIATIDEVHCLSEWGHDFRLSYLCLVKTIREFCPNVKFLGLTATASPAVIRDIKTEMGLASNDDIVTRLDMDRANLDFYVINVNDGPSKKSKLDKLLIDKNCFEDGHNTIVFTKTKNSKADKNMGCVNLFNEYKEKGASLFHGGNERTADEKAESVKDFISGKKKVMFATKAFGMGIDKPDIRCTIHYGMPPSLEALYQEAGRAGRDGNPADCYIIMYSPQNISKQRLDKLLSDNVTLNQIKLATARNSRNESRFDLGDIDSCLYFFKEGNYSTELQITFIKYIFNLLKTEPIFSYNPINKDFKFNRLFETLNSNFPEEVKFDIDKGTIDKNFLKKNIDNALYKLYILEVVEDWTIDWRANSYTVKTKEELLSFTETSKKEILENLYHYFKQREAGFDIFNGASRLEKEIHAEFLNIETDFLGACLKMLIRFSYYKFSVSQLRNMFSVYKMCDEYVDSETFRKAINERFVVKDSTNNILFEIIENEKNYNFWFDLLRKRKEEKLIPLLERYLADYQLNTGLNFVSGLLHIVEGDYEESTYGKERFALALDRIDNFNGREKGEIIRQIGREFFDEDIKIKNQISNILFKERKWCEDEFMQKCLGDEISAETIITRFADKISKIGGYIK